MVGDVLIHLGLGRGDRLEHVAEFEAQLGPLVADVVVGFFQLREVEVLLAAVGKLDRGLLCFVRVDIFLLAGLRRSAGAGFEFVGQRIHIGAPVGEDALHREQPRAGVVELSCGLPQPAALES